MSSLTYVRKDWIRITIMDFTLETSVVSCRILFVFLSIVYYYRMLTSEQTTIITDIYVNDREQT